MCVAKSASHLGLFRGDALYGQVQGTEGMGGATHVVFVRCTFLIDECALQKVPRTLGSLGVMLVMGRCKALKA